MCGIWGYIKRSGYKFDKNEYSELIKYIDNVKPRGPDKTNMIINDEYYLVFHRLAINDLSSLGDQPFCFIDGKKIIYLMVNGEIYNFKKIIEKYNFKTYSNSDCEVIYHLYKYFNNDIKKTLKELEGEFAFIITINDISKKKIKVIVARDRIGVRPLFYGYTRDGIVFSSILKGLTGLCIKSEVFPPGNYMYWNIDKDDVIFKQYYKYNYMILPETSNDIIYYEITERLIKAVKDRLLSDRPIGFLLSGGLDSSIICGIANKILGIENMKTFTIGMENSTDIKYSKMVAEHIKSDHTIMNFTPEEGLNIIKHVINATETWDITTIRASVGQYLMSKYIKENTDCKVVIIGDGSDEVSMGYLYYHLAPTPNVAHVDSIRLIKEIHKFDLLRPDRCISYHGLEARVPYLDTNYLDYYISIPPELKVPSYKGIEKYLLRKAFDKLYPNILPKEVLWRPKEAFSDGISKKEKSWFEIIQEWIDTQITDDEYLNNKHIYQYNTPINKESYYYRKIFDQLFNKNGYTYDNVIPHFWMPKWSNVNDPSARTLKIYHQLNNNL